MRPNALALPFGLYTPPTVRSKILFSRSNGFIDRLKNVIWRRSVASTSGTELIEFFWHDTMTVPKSLFCCNASFNALVF